MRLLQFKSSTNVCAGVDISIIFRTLSRCASFSFVSSLKISLHGVVICIYKNLSSFCRAIEQG